jgi:formamidopyrimidine-DNA glycosylase
MPELPEVEQVRRSLEPYLVEKTIEGVEIFLPKMVQYPSVETFAGLLTGQVVSSVERRGKYLRINLASGDFLLVHLRMTGAFLARKKSDAKPPYTRWGLHLSGEYNLWMTDIRTFGTVSLYHPDEPVNNGYAQLGPEPLDAALTGGYLREKARGKKSHIKSFILDQSVVAGLGNIYADETLFEAGLRPTKRVDRLTRKEWDTLAAAMRKIIRSALRHHGTTFRNYQDANGQMGDNFRFLNVYHRKGEPCKRCGTLLKQIKVGGRGSVYCPHCQK